MSDNIPVPLLDLKPQYQALKPELDAALARVAESQYFILGPEVACFEAGVAAYCGVDHGIGVSSGTDALREQGTKAQRALLHLRTAGAPKPSGSQVQQGPLGKNAARI